jgi:hypothetical protein
MRYKKVQIPAAGRRKKLTPPPALLLIQTGADGKERFISPFSQILGAI